MNRYIKLISLGAILSFSSFAHAGVSASASDQIHLASTFANITYQGEYVPNGGCCTVEKVHYQSVRYKHHHKKHTKKHHKHHKKHHRKHYKKPTPSCGCL